MTEIGFDAGGVAAMAAAYSAVVPLVEVPSGVLADRWSRRGVAMVAQVALIVSTVIGGLSTNVTAYVVAALFLGVFFAMQSGTYESIVYDTVLEETGDSEVFERTIGRVRILESSALVGGALVGGGLAEVIPLRATYFVTVPFVVAAIVSLTKFREPRLHRAEEVEPLRSQIRATYRTILERGGLRPIVALMVLTALLLQGVLEFGPLWMVALAAPAVLYGPHWAGLMAALGLGGLLGGRLGLTNRLTVAAVGAAMVACCLILTTTRAAVIAAVAQIVLVLLLIAVGIPLTRRLHDAVPSTIRAGVASGVGTLTWLAFLPFALVFGAVSNRAGVDAAAWLLTAVAALAALLLVTTVTSYLRAPAAERVAPSFPPDQFLPDDDTVWPGHWARPPVAWAAGQGVSLDADETITAVRTAIADLPSPYRDVIVLRDVDGRSPEAVRDALDLSPAAERDLLNQARGQVRAALERHFDRGAA